MNITPKLSGQVTQKSYTVSGYITDKASSETLIGASITAVGTQTGAVSNSYGFYSYTLPAGRVTLRYAYLGYSPYIIHLELAKDTVINISLNSDNQLQEIVVTGERQQAGFRSTSMGGHELKLTEILNTPAILGEADIMHTIQLLPGIQSGTDGFSGVYVRGGGPDENLIMLDGVPIYNPNHFLGIFSVFTPEAIKKTTLFKSSFPARYGGRLSSVIDVRTNDGNMQRVKGTFSVGILTEKLHLEGPLQKGKTTFSLSGRLTGLPYLVSQIKMDDQQNKFYFYDINAKLTHKINDNNRLYFGYYSGKDVFGVKYNDDYANSYSIQSESGDSQINWGNRVVSLRWNSVINSRLFANTTLAYNQYRMNMDSKTSDVERRNDQTEISKYEYLYRSGIEDISLRTDFDFSLSPRHELRFGYEWLRHSFRPETQTDANRTELNGRILIDTVYTKPGSGQLIGNEIALYAEDEAQFSKHFSANFGLHLSYFNTQGKNFFSLQPRLSVKYQFTDNWATKLAYTRMSQYVHLLSSSTISLPTDLWVPITRNIRPMESDQLGVGIYYDGIKGWEFSAESYYKTLHNILEYKEGTMFLGSSKDWEERVEMGEGRAMGLEIMLRKTSGRLTGWLAYTLSKSERRFPNGSINQGRWFPYKYDRRHNINLFLSYRLGRKTDFGATWTFYTGNVMTIPERQTVGITPHGTFYTTGFASGRNNYRLPSTNSLSLSFNRHLKAKRFESVWNFSLYNVLNSKNPTFVIVSPNTELTTVTNPYTGEYESIRLQKIKIKKYTFLPILPSISYTINF